MARKKIENPAYIIKNDDVFAKSNQIIRGKNTLSLLEEKTFTMAVQSAKAGYSEDVGTDTYVSYVSPSDVFDKDVTKSGSYYTRLKEISTSLLTQTIVIEPKDGAGQSFEAMNIFSYCSYDKSSSSLKCVFNPAFAKKELMEPVKDFTKLSKSVLMSFNKASSYKLYQNLRSYCYEQYEVLDALGGHTGKYKKNYSLDELRSVFSLVDINTPRKQKTPKKSYDKYSDLKRYVLQPSVDEINAAKTDLIVEYEEVKGAHGATTGIAFTVTLKSKLKPKTPAEDEIIDMCNSMDDVFTIALKVKDKKAILQVAEYNLDTVYEKYHLMPRSGIQNPVAWIIAAIKNDYKGSSVVVEEKSNETMSESISEMEKNFEEIWNTYPIRRGRARITTTELFEMSNYGWDQINRAVERYKKTVEKAREGGFQQRYQMGSTFFTKGYKDYLDDVYSEEFDENMPKKKNQFLNFEQADVNYDEIAAKKTKKMFMD